MDEYFVVCGGPMMGRPMTAEDAKKAVVTKTTSGFIILPTHSRIANLYHTPVEHTVNRAKSACIQCNFCTQLCPRHMLGHAIEPHKMMRRMAAGSVEEIIKDKEALNAYLCCECGVCELYACPMQLQPRQVNIMIKRALAKEGIRYQKTGEECVADKNREYRKIPSRRAANRADVGKYYDYTIKTCKEYTPSEVSIPLNQHIGAPAVPVVKVGDKVRKGQLIASPPEGKLGANIHASIGGTVMAADDVVYIKK